MSVVPVLKLMDVCPLVEAGVQHPHAHLQGGAGGGGGSKARVSRQTSQPAPSSSHPPALQCVRFRGSASSTLGGPPPTHLLVVLGPPPLIKLSPAGRLPQLLRRQRVAVQRQRGQRGAAGEQGRRHPPQPVAVQQQKLEVGQPAQLLWQCRQLVIPQVQLD